MADRIRAFDWAATPLGHPSAWPERLIGAVEAMLAMPQLASIAVGPERIFLYNDKASRQYGARHPAVLGLPLAAAFPHEFDRVAHFYDRVFAGESVHVPGQSLDPAQAGTPETFEAWLTPVRDAAGNVVAAAMIGIALDTRARTAAALRESEERQAFLLELSDALRPLDDPEAVKALAARLLGEHLGVNRAFYGEVEGDHCVIPGGYEQGITPLTPGSYAADTYGDWMMPTYREGRVLHFSDSDTDDRISIAERTALARLQIAAALGVGLVKGGNGQSGTLVAIFALHSATPRVWTEHEIGLVGDVADRTWAAVERARVEADLRESQAGLAYEVANITQLLEVSGLLIAGEDNEALYGRILDAAMAIMRADFASLQAYDAERGELRLLASRNFHPDSVAYWEHVSIASGTTCASALRNGERVVTADASAWDPAGSEHYRLTGITAVQSTPLTARDGRLVGMMSTHWRQGVTPSDTEFRSFDILTRQTADAFERAGAEAALRRNTRSFYSLIQNSPLGVYVVDADFRIVQASAQAHRTFGPAVGPLIGSDLDAALHAIWEEPFASEATARFRCTLETGEAYISHDTVEQRADSGTVEAYDWRVERIVMPDGRFGVVCYFYDQTERQQLEQALRESQERLRQFGEASQDVLWIRDAETLHWRYLTPAFQAIYGVSREEAQAGDGYRNWLDLIVPEDRDYAMENVARVQAGERVAFEFRIRRPSDGSIRWLRNTDFPILDAAGRVTLIGGIGSDITGLRAAEQRLNTLIERMPQLIWRAVDHGRWTWASPQWTAYTGQPEAESHGFGWLDRVHPDDRDPVMAIWAGAVDRGEFAAEYRLCAADGKRYRWFQTRATPVRGAGGAIVEWLGTSTDVDDLRRLQDRQQLLLAELQHRVRNILTVVHSVFSRTIEVAAPIEELADHFKGRLDSLARTQVIVTRNPAGLVDLEDLIREELLSVGVSDGPALTIEGPAVALSAKAAESIGLAVHELTTNALKYGALKIATARLEVRWTIGRDQGGTNRLDLTWNEHGVPAVPLKPARLGFGTELITEALPYRLGAETALHFRGGGVRCTISVPLPDQGTRSEFAWKDA